MILLAIVVLGTAVATHALAAERGGSDISASSGFRKNRSARDGLVTSATDLPRLTCSRTIHDDQNQLWRLSLSARDHPARDLALFPVHAELPRRRRFVGGARDHRFL